MIQAATRALEALGDVNPELQERLLAWLRHTDSVDLDAVLLGQLIQAEATEAQRLAEALVDHGVFEQHARFECKCGIVLSDESLEERRCRTCDTDLDESSPRGTTRYILERPRARDVGWLIAVHGIRTHGAWQEQLQWLIDREYWSTVPFRNWKYGKIFVDALVPRLQRRLVATFVASLRTSERELSGRLRAGAPPSPDVIAHSFGTWIVAHALQENSDLRLGRLILVGSIVRPDWDWNTSFERGQLGAVLNYCGDHDPWVRHAERGIPDAGPSGISGFVGQNDHLTNILRPGGRHSSAFAEDSLVSTFTDVWGPFLRDRLGDIDMKDHQPLASSVWARSRWCTPLSLGAGRRGRRGGRA